MLMHSACLVYCLCQAGERRPLLHFVGKPSLPPVAAPRRGQGVPKNTLT